MMSIFFCLRFAPLFVRISRSLLVLSLLFGLQGARGEVWINEFAADNETGLRTAAGVTADWIELVNGGPEPVDLGGWYLTDQASNLTKWRLPDGTIVGANSYLVIFADSSPVAVTNGQLHASFSLSKDGEYLGLVRPDGITIADEFAPRFPAQFQDISYGRGLLQERELVGAATPLRYRVPDSAGTASWSNAVGALGFSSTNGTFRVRYYEMNSSIADVNAAETMVADSRYWRTDRQYPLVATHDTINFQGTSSPGNFTGDVLFPGHSFPDEDRDNFAVVVDGAIFVPAAGLWTFAVGSDDGFRLRISGHGENFVSEYPTGRSFETTLATFNFPAPGTYSLSLIFYENYGGAGLELSVAQDFHEVLEPGTFVLLGDPAGGVLHAGAIGSLVETDVGPVMLGVNARLDAEWNFGLEQVPPTEDQVTLLVRSADGFTATLNGQAIATVNAPGELSWNSTATGRRSPEEAVLWLEFPVPSGVLQAGGNVLAIAGLNDSVTDQEFLLEARLTWRGARSFPAYFKKPTPGAPNGQAFTAPTPVVNVSEPRGYKNAPFTVSLSTWDPNAQIRYTLDGSVPRTNSPVYTAPLTVSKTTTLRAALLDPQTVQQNVTTVTWLFLEDILQQGSTPPTGWPASRQVNNHIMEYGLRAAIVTGDPVRLRNGMTNIPSISLVTDLANLFSAQRGIYVNPGNDGIGWERPVSVELIDPTRGNSSEFHIDAGLRIRGAFSRSSSNPKHSFRLFFRSEYGAGKLRFPLFEDEGASEFDKVDLRTSQNYSWAYENSNNETFVRETFSRDSQRDMGMPYTRSRYYHLYLNGQYWGLYQTQERSDADYAETYLGGENDDWDCIKTTQPGYTTTASDGNFNAFYALHNLAIVQGFTGAYANNYYRARGLNPDGTRNPAYPVYLDEDNLIVYMLVAYYTGDPDSPVSMWGGFPNNMYGLYNRMNPDGFKWLRHDAEHSLGAHSGYPVTCDTTLGGANFTTRGNFNPATLHQRLCQHPEYRRRFADLVQKHFYGDGALTPENAQNRFRSRMAEIDLAIIGESARWGRGKTRDGNWLPTCNSVVNNYLGQRRNIIVEHFRTRGWFPSLNAPGFSVMNREVPPGETLRISGTSTFYYTTNGSDPRLPDGTIHPSAVAVTLNTNPPEPRTLINRGATWRYYDLGAEPPASGQLTWRSPGYADSTWSQGPAILGFAGSATANPVATTTRRYVSGSSGPQVTTTYFRHTFTLDRTNGFSQLKIDLLRDDGVIIYLNGSEILRDNMGAGAVGYGTYSTSVVGSPAQNTYSTLVVDAANRLRVGANTVAIELHQCNSTSSDLYLDLSMTAVALPASIHAELAVTNDLTIKARAFNGTEWSALSENALTVQRPPPDYANLRVSELMYAPPVPTEPGPFVADDFAWLELHNHGAAPLDLEGVSFVSGITHTFGKVQLAPGGRLVLARNLAAFAARYATNHLNLVQWSSGNLARSGEQLSLSAPAGTNILTFTYSRVWYPETFNTGRSLVAVDLAAPEALWSTAANWRPGGVLFGTPGRSEPPAITAATLMPNGNLVLEMTSGQQITDLWVSEDLETWTRCDSAAWTHSQGRIEVDLQHASIPRARSFFRIQVLE